MCFVCQAKKRHWTLPAWTAAWHKYALAACVTEQLTYAAALAHLDVCLRVADEARARKLPMWVAFKYDELVRPIFRLTRVSARSALRSSLRYVGIGQT